MGLDQYAYAVEIEKSATIQDVREVINSDAGPEQIGEWRKHPNLEGWMSDLWHARQQETVLDGIVKGRLPGNTAPDYPKDFNCEYVELFSSDLDRLERLVISGDLPKTGGFFWGSDSDDYYKESDREFIRAARKQIASGSRIFYSSWW